MAKKIEQKKDEKEALEKAGREQIKQQNKILKSILIGVAILILAIFLFFLISKSFSKFEYEGVKFEVVRFCDAGPPCLITYRTSIPVKTMSDGSLILAKPSEKSADYNIYLRNDPRKLDVNFNGSIYFKDNTVFNVNSEFICEGDGAIAGANFNLLYRLLGSKVISDKNATCDSLGRYTLIEVMSGDKTKVEQFGPSCYNIYIKDCEVLEGMERFMIETLIEFNKAIKEA